LDFSRDREQRWAADDCGKGSNLCSTLEVNHYANDLDVTGERKKNKIMSRFWSVEQSSHWCPWQIWSTLEENLACDWDVAEIKDSLPC
jgi:hypothetical protein